jgi:hypothetical protein
MQATARPATSLDTHPLPLRVEGGVPLEPRERLPNRGRSSTRCCSLFDFGLRWFVKISASIRPHYVPRLRKALREQTADLSGL